MCTVTYKNVCVFVNPVMFTEEKYLLIKYILI